MGTDPGNAAISGEIIDEGGAIVTPRVLGGAVRLSPTSRHALQRFDLIIDLDVNRGGKIVNRELRTVVDVVAFTLRERDPENNRDCRKRYDDGNRKPAR